MKTEVKKFGIQRYFLLWVTLSFLGWVFETSFVFLAFWEWHNQGFLALPVCPIYAGSLMAMYWLAGTIDTPRGLLKRVENKWVRYGLYVGLSFLVPTVAELAVGFVLDKGFNTWLWDYGDFALNYRGYVCVPVSLVWMALILVFMKWAFPFLQRQLGKISKPLSWGLAALFFVALGIDFFFSVLQRL